jgi:beta-RFAP synthase
MQEKPTSRTISVSAPARLHLGFLDLNGGLGRRYGSIGLAVDAPATEISIARSADFAAEGPDGARALAAVRSCAEALGLSGPYRITVASAIPPHAGLGSGTQLALAVGAALAGLEGLDIGPDAVAKIAGRGARSGIGLAAFSDGGFLIDGGRGDKDRAPPLLVRAEFPPDWRILLILDPAAQGAHGDREASAFAALPPFPEAKAAHLCRLVPMRLLPAIKEQEIEPFGAALSEIQEIVGGHFASAQGGSSWTSPAVGRLAKRLAAAGATGIGQTSWGPTGFAFTASDAAAGRLYDSFAGEARAEGLDVRIVRGRNTGARIGRA